MDKEEILNELRHIASLILEIDINDININKPLYDNGFESIDVVKFSVELRRKYKVDIPFKKLISAKSFIEISEYIQKHILKIPVEELKKFIDNHLDDTYVNISELIPELKVANETFNVNYKNLCVNEFLNQFEGICNKQLEVMKTQNELFRSIIELYKIKYSG